MHGKDKDAKEKDNRLRKSSTRSTTGYSRIVGKRRLPNGSHQNPKYAVDPAHKMSTFSSIADKFMSFMNGESDAVSMCILFLNQFFLNMSFS